MADPDAALPALSRGVRTISRLFLLPGAALQAPDVAAWFAADQTGLRALARRWFNQMRACGPDVCEILHDGHPTACTGDAAFGYVNAFTAHVNVGFFHGADLDDPAGILVGTGKRMRHVKLWLDQPIDEPALQTLIAAAYRDIHLRIASLSQAG